MFTMRWRGNRNHFAFQLPMHDGRRHQHLRNINLALFLSATPENVRTDVSKLCIKKTKPTIKGSLAGPYMPSISLVPFDGREGKPLKRDASLCCVCNSPMGAREGSQGPEPGDRGGRHGWIWVPAVKQWKKGGGRKKGKEQDKKEAAFT